MPDNNLHSIIKLQNEQVLKTLDNVVRVFEMPLEVQ